MTTKVIGTTVDGIGNLQETWSEEVDLEVVNIGNVIETDTIVIETMIRIEIGITTEVRTGGRVVVVDGKESRKTESLGTAIGVIAKIAQIGMKGIPSFLHKMEESKTTVIRMCANYIVHVVLLTVKEVLMEQLSALAVRKLSDTKVNRQTTQS